MAWAVLLVATLTVVAFPVARATVPAPAVSSIKELVLAAWIVRLPAEDETVPLAPPKVNVVELKVLVLYVPLTVRLSDMATVDESMFKYLVPPPLFCIVNSAAPMAELASCRWYR
jgi:hypothetical protein